MDRHRGSKAAIAELRTLTLPLPRSSPIAQSSLWWLGAIPLGILARSPRSDDERFVVRPGSEASETFVPGRRSSNQNAPTAQVKPHSRNPLSGGSVPLPLGILARSPRSDDTRFAARPGSEASATFVSGRRSSNQTCSHHPGQAALAQSSLWWLGAIAFRHTCSIPPIRRYAFCG